jgi:hypothetical protein
VATNVVTSGSGEQELPIVNDVESHQSRRLREAVDNIEAGATMEDGDPAISTTFTDNAEDLITEMVDFCTEHGLDHQTRDAQVDNLVKKIVDENLPWLDSRQTNPLNLSTWMGK